MPANRRSVPKEEKTDEIVRAARRQLEEGGYRGLSIGRVAAELGIAENSIYWYFPTKDDLFVAAVRALVETIPLDKRRSADTIEDVAVRAVSRLAELQPIRGALLERAAVSEPAAALDRELRERFADLAAALLVEANPDGAGSNNLATSALMAIIEGLLRMDVTRSDRGEILRYALRRFAAESQP